MPLKPRLNVLNATSVSCIFPLPDSMGTISNLTAININIAQEEGTTHHPILFSPLFPTPEYTETFVTVNPIGFSKINSVMVYKALSIATSVNTTCSKTYFHRDRFYALKVIDANNPESLLMFREEARKSRVLRGMPHENLLGIHLNFWDKQTGKCCVVVNPHIPGGSIRAIMKNSFSKGFPEDLILCVLRSVLKALKFLHGHPFMHGDINAGHVYLCDKNQYLIKLGFAATLYEDVNEMENTPYLPMVSMSKWAAAPEVYNDENQPYTEKADIWLVGITALELAFGGLEVSNRNALEAMIKEISLPPSKKTKPNDEAKMLFKSYVKKLLTPFSYSSLSSKSNVNVDDNIELVSPPLSSYQENYSGQFSESFTDMVTQCLAWDSKKRPTVDRLLSYSFFTNSLCRKDGQYFYDALIKKTSAPALL